MLFNIAIDFLYRDLCEPQFAAAHGFKLYQDLPALSIMGFADDQVVISDTLIGIQRLTHLTQSMFASIGLTVNPSKSNAIIIRGGALHSGQLELLPGSSSITSIDDITHESNTWATVSQASSSLTVL